MPQSSTPSARRWRRSIAAAISGLAIGVAGVGAAALPAVADPAAGGGAPPAASDTSPAAAAGETHTVTLITGDRVHVTDLAGGAHAVRIETAVEGAAVQTAELGGELHVLPRSAMPYLAAGVVDDDLFNVTRLIEFGYDDASVDATPIIVEYTDGPTTHSAPLPGVEVGTTLESVGGAAATAEHATAAVTWNALTGASGPRAFSTEVALGGGIDAIHLDGKVRATLDSSVPWIGAREAWEAGFTGEGVTVAVLDTGYDDTHADLAGRVLPESTSFVPGEDVADDPNGHGTHVASTIAGTGAASEGVHRGVADGADLLVGKVLGADGSGQDSWIIEAMEWAGANADIVSMSLGSSQADDGNDPMSEALNTISEQTGALFVVAAGNSYAPETIGSPGSAERALTIASVLDPSGARSEFSSQGPLAISGALKPELAGPGSDITAARSADSPGDGSYIGMSGTSMATPHVAGAAAILKQQHPEYTGDQIRSLLISSATDVGLTSYETGSGVVDIEQALDAPVVAAGSGDFGTLAWGEAPEAVVRAVDYTNRTADEVVLTLSASLGGAPEGVVAIDVDTLEIPAGETRTVTMTADPAAVPGGTQYSGTLVASIDGTAVARTAIGIIAEPERYDLTITATGFDGEPVDAYGILYQVETGYFELIGVAGEQTMRLPGGRYSVMSYMDVDVEADSKVTALVGDPDLVLDAPAAVAFDARATKPVTVDVGKAGLEAAFSKMSYRVDGFTGSIFGLPWIDGFTAQPLEAPKAEDFGFTTRWRLQQPTLALAAGKEQLDLITQAGSVLLDGKVRADAVDAGTGSAAEFAALGSAVAGRIAVVTRSNDVSPHSRAVNALAAGAKLLLVVNDADGELSEWVGSDDYLTSVAIPVAAMSGVQGSRLLDAIAAKKVTITGLGVPTATETFDIANDTEGSIPAKLDYRPEQLARIDTSYHGNAGEPVGEFRYDYAPGVQYGEGFMQRTERGIERTEWVNTGEVEWYQFALALDAGWEVRGLRQAYEPGSVSTENWFSPIVRPYVGPGYWAPNRQGGWAQVNVPSWGDGGSAQHTGAFDIFSGRTDRSQLTEVWIDGELFSSSPWQAATVFDLPDGETAWRVRNTARHDGTYLASSTETVSEWTFRSSGTSTDLTEQLLPMLQAFYDVDLDTAGTVGAGRKAGAPVELGLEIGHIAGAIDSDTVTAATLEKRVVGGEWTPVELQASETDAPSGPVDPGADDFVESRAFVSAYRAAIAAPDAGAWIDLRVTATDAAGNTFSQQIVRAFEVAPAKSGAPKGPRGGRF
ncbi:S8 family peptidase [Agromyces humatus]|uniref:S8 family serine peptidase n=1 Tax=Agromyces humatus TaxID=279573 RepID=A0ABP4WSN0_9MICO|nr:S8 family serine peptidase [Agromyces humatus]